MAANPKDPNAPSPEGSTMTPALGPQLVIPAGLPRNLEAAIQRYGSATYKAPVAFFHSPSKAGNGHIPHVRDVATLRIAMLVLEAYWLDLR